MFHKSPRTTRASRASRQAAQWHSRARRLLALTMSASLIFIGLLNKTQAAAAGDLDPTFSGDGKVITSYPVTAIAVQADGKTLAAGSVFSPRGPNPHTSGTDHLLIRYNSNGSPDQTFGTGGMVKRDGSPLDEARDIVIQPDHKILVTGVSRLDFQSIFTSSLARYNPDGSLDQDFGGGAGVVSVFGYGGNPFGNGMIAIALQPDGRIVGVGLGVFNHGLVIVRYNGDGSPDDGSVNDSTPADSFGDSGFVITPVGSGYNGAAEVAVQPDGKILLAAGAADFSVARYNTDGSPDDGSANDSTPADSFGNDGIATTDFFGERDSATSVALQADGKIVAAGYATGNDQTAAFFALARYRSDGSPDTSFSGDGRTATAFLDKSYAESIAIQIDGKLVVVGWARDSSHSEFAIARYAGNGKLDPGFGAGGKETNDFGSTAFNSFAPKTYEVALQPDGRIMIGGDDTLARYKNDASSITPLLNSLSLSSTTVSSCGRITGTLTLNSPAPARGVAVDLSSSNEAASVPARIQIPAGETTRSFSIAVKPGANIQAVNIVARLGAITKSTQLVIKPAGLASLTLNPNPSAGSQPVTGVVALKCPAPEGGVTITLSSSNPAAARPVVNTIVIPEGLQVKSFTVRTFDASAPRSATIKATANGTSKSAVLTIN
jgi:uncharacterized delta-60 repeat protein